MIQYITMVNKIIFYQSFTYFNYNPVSTYDRNIFSGEKFLIAKYSKNIKMHTLINTLIKFRK